MRLVRCITLLLIGAVAPACATSMPSWDDADPTTQGEARRLLARSVEAVSGPMGFDEARVSYAGEWGFWIRRIQPEVTDSAFRRTAVDIVRPGDDRIEQVHSGPGGDKRVAWDGSTVSVTYVQPGDDDEAPNETVGTEREGAAAALVAEAYQLFLLGPRYLASHADEVRSLAPTVEEGRTYERLIARLAPGLGFSEEDFVVLWVDAETGRPFRVHFTLEGFETTRGAHADTTYVEWMDVDGHAFPSRYVERVRGPIGIFAHEWWVTHLELR